MMIDHMAVAREIVRSYREDCPRDFDPKNWYVSTTLITLALVSAAVSAGGAAMSASAQSDSAKYNAAIASNNAGAAYQQAQFDTQQIRDKNTRMLATQRAAYAAGGGVADSGSAADVRADSAQQGEMQALMALYTGKTQSQYYQGQSVLASHQADNAMTAGEIGIGTSLLGGVSSAAFMDSTSKNPTFLR